VNETRLRPEAARHLVPLIERARQSFRHGQTAAAEQLCIEILDLAPDHFGALEILFRLRQSQGRPRAAEVLLRRLVRLHPNEAGLTRELAAMLMNKGDLAGAEAHARNAVRVAPTDPSAHNVMGMILTESFRPQAGEYHYRRVLELSGKRDPVVLANLAWNLKSQGRIAEARALYQEAAAAAPQAQRIVLGWARMEEADRDFAAAGALLDRAEAIRPGDAGVRLARAILYGRTKRYDEAVALLDAMPDDSGGARPLDTNELLEKGRLLDKLGRFDEAFATYQEAKRLAREITGQTYNAEAARDMSRRLVSFFTGKRLGFTPRGTRADGMPQPIFILGFPRSGTTLVEQSLSAHPRIRAGDELPMIHDITQLMPRVLNSPFSYPEALAELWMGDQHQGLDTLRDYYFQRARQLGVIGRPHADPGGDRGGNHGGNRGGAGKNRQEARQGSHEARRAEGPEASWGAPWFTDKMPLNETHLGLIALIFPDAPLIHVRRHPLDVVLSVFSNHLTHGYHCAFDLMGIARHYVLVSDLVDHYRTEMALRYLPIRYEDIVDDQEASIRRLLSFIGEPFDARCLRFQDNPRHARTASYAQVTEPLYNSSRYRYRHYRRQLAPVLEVLEPTIARLGYTVEWDAAQALAA
jgi:tetratricopeptide (TPR) repeat protein